MVVQTIQEGTGASPSATDTVKVMILAVRILLNAAGVSYTACGGSRLSSLPCALRTARVLRRHRRRRRSPLLLWVMALMSPPLLRPDIYTPRRQVRLGWVYRVPVIRTVLGKNVTSCLFAHMFFFLALFSLNGVVRPTIVARQALDLLLRLRRIRRPKTNT